MYNEITVLYNHKQPTFTGGPNFLQGGPGPPGPPAGYAPALSYYLIIKTNCIFYLNEKCFCSYFLNKLFRYVTLGHPLENHWTIAIEPRG